LGSKVGSGYCTYRREQTRPYMPAFVARPRSAVVKIIIYNRLPTRFTWLLQNGSRIWMVRRSWY